MSRAAPARAGGATRVRASRMERSPQDVVREVVPDRSSPARTEVLSHDLHGDFTSVRNALARGTPCPARPGLRPQWGMTDSPARPAPLADPPPRLRPRPGTVRRIVVILRPTGSIGTQAIRPGAAQPRPLPGHRPLRERRPVRPSSPSRRTGCGCGPWRSPARTSYPRCARRCRRVRRPGAAARDTRRPDAATQAAASRATPCSTGITGSIGLAPTLLALNQAAPSRSPTRRGVDRRRPVVTAPRQARPDHPGNQARGLATRRWPPVPAPTPQARRHRLQATPSADGPRPAGSAPSPTRIARPPGRWAQ